MSKLPISVIIPAYNAERFIGRAIGSVNAQTVSVTEIIVVDNFSTDRTAEIAEEMGAKVLRKNNYGRVAASRNLGIEASKGEWVAFLDADDYWDKRKIEFQTEAIRRCPDAGIVTTGIRLVGIKDSRLKDYWQWLNDYGWALPGRKLTRNIRLFSPANNVPVHLGGILTSAVMLRRDVFSVAGVFDETLPAHEDADLWLRVLNRYSWAFVDRKLTTYRRHDENFTNDAEHYRSAYRPWLEKMLKSSGDYPSGAIEDCSKFVKTFFIMKGREMSKTSGRLSN